MATARDIPKTLRAAFHGLRSKLRRIIRVEIDRNLAKPRRSAIPSRNCGGDSGRIASAGGSATTQRSDDSAPRHAAAQLFRMLQKMSFGPATNVSSGNRKKYWYMRLKTRPSQIPTGAPATAPSITATIANFK